MKVIAVLFLLTLGHVMAQEDRPEDIACSVDRPVDMTMDETSGGLMLNVGYVNRTHGSYEPNMLCEWRINSTDGTPIEILFLDMEIEFCTDCKCDGVRIWTGTEPGEDSEAIGSYCGTEVPESFEIEEDQAFVRFYTDAGHEFRGFLARFGFTLDSTACTPERPDTITRPQGVFATPDYPADYPSDANCQWLLQAPEGQRIRIAFLDLEIEEACNRWDTVRVLDGGSISSPILGQWDGRSNTLPGVMETRGNEAMIYFTSDSTIEYSGFVGVWEFFTD
jgi:hypothetical protein